MNNKQYAIDGTTVIYKIPKQKAIVNLFFGSTVIINNLFIIVFWYALRPIHEIFSWKNEYITSVMYWYFDIVTVFCKVSTKNIPLFADQLLACITCINKLVQLFRLLTKKRNRKTAFYRNRLIAAFSNTFRRTSGRKIVSGGRKIASPGENPGEARGRGYPSLYFGK